MKWFGRTRALRFLVGATIYALAWWLAVGAVAAYRPSLRRDASFTVVSFHADYLVIPLDYAGISMHVVETIVVDFPDDGEEHRIERVLPTINKARATPITGVSALMDDGWAPVEVRQGLTQLRAVIGSPTTAPGRHTYRVSYLYSNVFVGPASNEFSWNINGTSWPQEIGSVSATITLEGYDEESDSRCYVGDGESTPKCVVERRDTVSGAIFRSSSVQVGAHQSQTVEISGLIFVLGIPPLATPIWVWLVVVWLVVGSFAIRVGVNLRRAAKRNWDAGEYARPLRSVPGADLPPIVVGALVGYPGRGVVAEVLRAASQQHVTLSGGGSPATPLTAELVSWPVEWSADSQAALGLVFRSREPGVTVNVADALHEMTADEVIRLRDTSVDRGLVSSKQRSDAIERSMRRLLAATAIAIPAVIVSGRALSLPPWWIGVPVAVLVASLAMQWGWLFRWRERTDLGHRAMRELNEVKQFLTASESAQERAMEGDDTTPEPDQLITIYQRLLPTAVAAGQEAAWLDKGSQFQDQLDWLTPGGITVQRLGLDTSWAYDNSPAGLSFGDVRQTKVRAIFSSSKPSPTSAPSGAAARGGE